VGDRAGQLHLAELVDVSVVCVNLDRSVLRCRLRLRLWCLRLLGSRLWPLRLWRL